MTEPAPFYADVAEGPSDVAASWVRAQDGTRLRMAVWPNGAKGTVLMFPGRTEYVEKYGRVASDLAAHGYGMAAFDWRGQGLSDRPAHRRDMGHVVSFDEYRQDVAAFRAAMESMNLPKPWFLIGHSMGGCIGLRALYDGLPVAAAAFTGPMWGLQMAPLLKTVSPLVMVLAGPFGFGKAFAPTTGPWEPLEFENNTLTTDRNQFDYMSRQTDKHPELSLGGPSLTWVKAAIIETSELMELEPLDMPTVAIVGTGERVVDIDAVKTRMASWPKGSYLSIEGGEHEVLMETDVLRTQSLQAILALFDRAAG
ncbi:alpha/beta hydrolase [Rhodobacteraceae bacterium N5(2021)]|uniref:Alpha/beta hydrolase n=2 Tax=Gymnodinialimonas phycosphaerae TaxID=2841589 RepID=A0A975YI12_9RHOB|nr:alpha/beta hydrolase [Gymnodinialimonas phycosphaerae]